MTVFATVLAGLALTSVEAETIARDVSSSNGVAGRCVSETEGEIDVESVRLVSTNVVRDMRTEQYLTLTELRNLVVSNEPVVTERFAAIQLPYVVHAANLESVKFVHAEFRGGQYIYWLDHSRDWQGLLQLRSGRVEIFCEGQADR